MNICTKFKSLFSKHMNRKKTKMKITNVIAAISILSLTEILFVLALKSTGFIQLLLHYLADMIFIFSKETHTVQLLPTIIYGAFSIVLVIGVLYAMLSLIPRFILASFDVTKEK